MKFLSMGKLAKDKSVLIPMSPSITHAYNQLTFYIRVLITIKTASLMLFQDTVRYLKPSQSIASNYTLPARELLLKNLSRKTRAVEMEDFERDENGFLLPPKKQAKLATEESGDQTYMMRTADLIRPETVSLSVSGRLDLR